MKKKEKKKCREQYKWKETKSNRKSCRLVLDNHATVIHLTQYACIAQFFISFVSAICTLNWNNVQSEDVNTEIG